MGLTFYNTTGGGTGVHNFGGDGEAYSYATKIIVPEGETANITQGLVSFGVTVAGGIPFPGLITAGQIQTDSADAPSGITVIGSTFYSNTFTASSGVANRSGAIDINLTEGTYWVVVTFANSFVFAGANAATITKNPGQTLVLSEAGWGHAGRSGDKTSPGAWSLSDNVADLYFSLSGPTLPTKAYNPVPADEETEDGVYDGRLAWANGADTDDVDIYIGTESGSLSSIASAVETEYYDVAEEDFPENSVIYWRVDANNDDGTTPGDEWWFDPRPGAATNPTPDDGTTSLSVTQSRLYWDAGKLNQTFNVYIDGVLVEEDTTDEYYDISNWGSWPLQYSTSYTWYVKAKNVHGEEDSDTWTFTTAAPYSMARPSTYDPDVVWDISTEDWVDFSDITVSGGGRYQSQIVVVGHNVIYFGDI